MRPELNHIAKIDAYLDNELSQEELVDFRTEMILNTSLKDEVESQRKLRDHIKLIAFKERVAVHQQKVNLLRISKIVIIIAAVVFSFFFFLMKLSTHFNTSNQVENSKQTNINCLITSKGDSLDRKHKENNEAILEPPNDSLSTKILPSKPQAKSIKPEIKEEPEEILSVIDSVIKADTSGLEKEEEITKNLPSPSSPIDLWRIRDKFSAYRKLKIIPISVKSNSEELKVKYNISGIKGEQLLIVLHSPSGKKYTLANEVKYNQTTIKNHVLVPNEKGLWNMHIHTKGRGNFDINIKTNPKK